MVFYVNDIFECMIVFVCRIMCEVEIYVGWVNEYLGVFLIRFFIIDYNDYIIGDCFLGYFGFMIDLLVDRVFILMFVRIWVDSNKLLIKIMLKNLILFKVLCCF